MRSTHFAISACSLAVVPKSQLQSFGIIIDVDEGEITKQNTSRKTVVLYIFPTLTTTPRVNQENLAQLSGRINFRHSRVGSKKTCIPCSRFLHAFELICSEKCVKTSKSNLIPIGKYLPPYFNMTELGRRRGLPYKITRISPAST